MLLSPPGNWAIFSLFWGDFLTQLNRKNPLEKIQNKSSGDGTPISVTCRGRTRLETKAHDFLEGCGCFRGLSGGSRGKLRESPGKIAGKCFPNREMLQILGFRAAGKANLPGTLGPHCRNLVPTYRAGCF